MTEAERNMLREYAAALDAARTERGVKRIARSWSTRLAGMTVVAKQIRFAHYARVAGTGSPAECDAALNRAIAGLTTERKET